MEKRLIDANALKPLLREYCIDGDEVVAKWYDIMGVDEVIDRAPTVDATPRWIPVEERLPEIKEGFCSKDVIVALDNGSLAFTCLESNTFGQVCWQVELVCELQFEKDVNVIAWMPLPDPYVGERKDDE